jgi:hypothetical protein
LLIEKQIKVISEKVLIINLFNITMKKNKLAVLGFFMIIIISSAIYQLFLSDNAQKDRQSTNIGIKQVSNFEECIAAGNPAMESYPRQCRHEGRTFIESQSAVEGKLGAIDCKEEERNVDACIEIYQPVCGQMQVECITAPCDPAKQTFENSCKACANDRVLSYVEGECMDDNNVKY